MRGDGEALGDAATRKSGNFGVSSATITAYQDAASRQIGNFRATPPEDALTAQNAGGSVMP
jgi:hypothetical protein